MGKIEIVEFNLQEGEVKFGIWNNFFAERCDEESACCNCVDDFVSGLYKQIVRKTPNIQKTRCIEPRRPLLRVANVSEVAKRVYRRLNCFAGIVRTITL